MQLNVDILVETIDRLTPFHLAEEWDNVGIMVGSRQAEVRGILTALDLSTVVLAEAVERGCSVILTHHPLLFHPLKQILTDSAEGRLLQQVLARELTVIATHTSFDNAEGGVSDHLGHLLGLVERRPLLPLAEAGTGCGCIGRLPEPVAGERFFVDCTRVLNLPGAPVAGTLPQMVAEVAICGGSGSAFARSAREQGADLYLCGELKHDTALWAHEEQFCIIDGGHYATEKPAMALLTERLAAALSARGFSVPIVESTAESSPLVWRGAER